MLTERREQYSFVVDVKATKPEIKAEVEKMYGVEVADLSTLIMRGKRKFKMTRTGVQQGKKSNFKKAIVKLKEGQSIDFYESV